jgi:hypothetical protein
MALISSLNVTSGGAVHFVFSIRKSPNLLQLSHFGVYYTATAA